MKVGIIGCGAIGTILANALDKMEKITKIYLFDRNKEREQNLSWKLKKSSSVRTPKELILRADLIIEAASQDAVREYAQSVLEAKKDLMVMSVGALADGKLYNALERTARNKNVRIYIPSGAIVGIDGMNAAKLERVDEVILITTKNPAAFSNSKYLKIKKISAEKIRRRTVLFEGSALKAVRYFPENINVSACLAIAGIGAKKTKVKIVADPKIRQNIHRVIVKGAFGEFYAETKNFLCPKNPKTSYLAALSAIATVKKILAPSQVGT